MCRETSVFMLIFGPVVFQIAFGLVENAPVPTDVVQDTELRRS